MIYRLILIVTVLISSAAFSQLVPLKVSFSTAANEPLPQATIQLYSLPDTILLSAQFANSNEIIFSVNELTSYLVKVSAIGYLLEDSIIAVKDKALKISFHLKKTSTTLSDVVVTSRKQLLRQEDDKTIVDATVLANSSTNAYEVLEKTPGTVIDQDGNVYLSSTTPATVFINGREMKLSSSDIASLLKSLPAGSVSKIEIMRTPSAKFDAASSGGIINIVLKKGVKIGSSGSVNLGYFQGVYATETIGVNINKGSGKINSYFNYQFTNRNNYEALQSTRLIKSDTSLLLQNAYTTYPSRNYYLGAGVDVAPTKSFNMAYDVRMSNTNGKSLATNSIDVLKSASNALLEKNQSDITNKNISFFIANNISSKYKIDTLGSEWTTELNYNYFSNNGAQVYKNSFYLPAEPAVSGDGDNKNDKHIFVVQTDLVLKLPDKITLESGFKTTISKSNNIADYFYQTAYSSRQPDLYQTNTFKYQETIAAAYLQLAKTFYGFTLKPGMRLETTNINGRQLIPKDTALSIKRTDLFPYVFLRHNLFKMFGTSLVGSAIFRKSIKRPYYEILNPYPKYVDQYLFDVGNPNLQPQLTTNYEFNVTFTDFPVFAVGVNETKNIFSNVTYQDDVTKIAYRTYDNVGTNKEVYFRVVGGIPPGGKYFFYLGAQYNLNKYDGLYQNLPLNYKQGSWLFFMYQEFKASSTLTLDVQGFMRSRALQNFYELANYGGLYVSANKSFLKKKANLIFSVNDLLQTNQVAFSINQGNVNAQGKRVNDTRRFGITLRYNFGLNKPKETRSFGTPVDSKEN